MMMAYPTENMKGTFVAIVWVIFNLGGVLGGLAAMVCFFNTWLSVATDTAQVTYMCIWFHVADKLLTSLY